MPPHIHQKNEEILHVLKGQLDCFIGKKKKKYTLKDGETIAIPPKNLHAWRAVKNTITYEVFSPPRTKIQMEKLAESFKEKKQS